MSNIPIGSQERREPIQDGDEYIKTMTGRVAHFKKAEGYGFITPDDSTIDDVFVYHTSIEPWRKGFKDLQNGEIVKFDLVQTSKGLHARNVEKKRNPVEVSKFTHLPDEWGNRK